MSIQDNIARVQERVAAACRRAGRGVEDVRLIAVSKTFPAECIREAYAAGLREFGENRVQEAAAKVPVLADLNITWHLIGRLQTNKARRAGELFQWVHSIDSEALAGRLNQTRADDGGRFTVLLQVNLGDEESKSGIDEREVLKTAEAVGQFSQLDVRGLMAIPPFCKNPEDARPFFRRLRELGGKIRAARVPNVSMQHLSMGMSHDFEVAIEEGATMIRVGTAIFGVR
ncbi:MAG: YggS family pyridoxal phosphate-dependent enzyme [Terriglobia bacterium]